VSWSAGAPYVQYNIATTIDAAFGSAGSKMIKVFVMDEDGEASDTLTYNLSVEQGAPVIDSIKIDTTINNIFVKDSRKYRVYCSDINGKVKKIYASWNSGSSTVDSINVDITGSGNGEFTHYYDTTLSGNRTVRFSVMDDDSVVSGYKDTTFTVHKAPPVLSGDKADTLWVVIDSGVERNYPIHINHTDTNGTIGSCFWSGNPSPLGRATSTDTIMRNFSAGDLIVPFNMYIYGRDDDSLVRGGRFVVFADSAPPMVTFLDRETAQDSIVFKWENLHDTHDGVKTKVQIYIKQGTAGEPNIPLFDTLNLPSLDDPRFRSQLVGGIPCYTYKYKCPFQGAGRWRVVLQDARGSRTAAPAMIGDRRFLQHHREKKEFKNEKVYGQTNGNNR
jgi:hypothetical protein